MVFSIVYGLLGIYVIFTGFRTIMTGKLSASEEKRMAEFTEKAAKTYKLTNAVISILIGLLMIALAVIEILLDQKIIEGDKTVFTLIFLGSALILGLVVMFVWFKCKKDSKNGKG